MRAFHHRLVGQSPGKVGQVARFAAFQLVSSSVMGLSGGLRSVGWCG